jgi:hypothetical protein
MTLSIKNLSITTLSKMTLKMTISTYKNNVLAECHNLVTMLNAVMLIVIMLTVAAPLWVGGFKIGE